MVQTRFKTLCGLSLRVTALLDLHLEVLGELQGLLMVALEKALRRCGDLGHLRFDAVGARALVEKLSLNPLMLR